MNTYILQKGLPDGSIIGDEYVCAKGDQVYKNNNTRYRRMEITRSFIENNPEWFKLKEDNPTGKILSRDKCPEWAIPLFDFLALNKTAQKEDNPKVINWWSNSNGIIFTIYFGDKIDYRDFFISRLRLAEILIAEEKGLLCIIKENEISK